MLRNQEKDGTYNAIFQWQNLKLKLVGEGVVVGLFSGLVIVLYRYLVEKSGGLTKQLYSVVKGNMISTIILFIVLIAMGYLVGKIVKSEPMISGSGIPQVEGILLGKLDMNWGRVLIKKFFGGLLTLLAGLSVGREGPSVQMGSAVGQGCSRIFKRSKVEEKFLITSGASAGLAAAFNAPLAGVMFSLEEAHKNFSPLVLLSAMSSALTADFIAKNFFGLTPIFDFTTMYVLPLKYYFCLVILGIIVAILGVVFNKTLILTQDLYAYPKWLTVELRPIIPFIVAGVLGFVMPSVLGGGHHLIEDLNKSNFTINMLLLILLVKFLFTMVSFGSGVPGGIFLPLLVIGALIGQIYGMTLSNVFGLNSKYIMNFMILGMAGYFTAIVKAPITGSVLIVEMTGSFTHLLSLSLVCITAYVVTEILKSEPVYEMLLDRFLKKNGKENIQEESKRKILLESVVTVESALAGKRISELKWPEKCLLVSIQRGGKELIPKGNTMIYPGDYLIILANEDNESDIKACIKYMTKEYVL